jgi:hypothetical protein
MKQSHAIKMTNQYLLKSGLVWSICALMTSDGQQKDQLAIGKVDIWYVLALETMKHVSNQLL